MRFWDSSALVPLLVGEASTAAAMAELESDSDMLVWWGSEVECVSALARLGREGALEPAAIAVALERLRALGQGWQQIEPTTRVRDVAERVLRVHPLRAGDALQLAAGIVAAEDRPQSLPFVTLDGRLAEAAEKEGFPIVLGSV